MFGYQFLTTASGIWRHLWRVNIREDVIFRDTETIRAVCNGRMSIALIGNDIKSLYRKKNTQNWKYVCLAVATDDPVPKNFKATFLGCLHEHEHGPLTNEVKLTRHRVIMNISALNDEEEVMMDDPTRLFAQTSTGLSTSMLYVGCPTPEEVPSPIPEEVPIKDIGGLCAHPPTSLSEVRDVCSVNLKNWDGSCYPFVLNTPQCRYFEGYNSRRDSPLEGRSWRRMAE